MNNEIEYDINGNDDFEYAQGLCSHAEEYYGLDLTSEALDAHLEAQWEEYFECDS